MSATESEAVVAAIRAARVPYPRDEVLTAFVQRAADSERAARFPLSRCGTPSGALNKTSIDVFLADWEQLVRLFERKAAGRPLREEWVSDTIRSRENNTCRLTDQQGSWRDPLAVYPIFQLPKASLTRQGSLPLPLHEMLCAFLGDDLAAWVCAGCEIESPVASHWLVLRSAAETFAHRFWSVEPLEGCPLKFVVFSQAPYGYRAPVVVKSFDKKHGILMFDRHPDVEMPDGRALETTARFSEAIRWVASYQDVPLRPRLLSADSLDLCQSYRFRAYSTFGRTGRAIYGPSASRYVQQLPFSMYLKLRYTSAIEAIKDEVGALVLIRSSSSLNVPQPLDLVSDERLSYMITGRPPGVSVQSVYVHLSDEHLMLLAQDLRAYLADLRHIHKPPGLATAIISNTIGGGCIHNRLDEAQGTSFDPHGPFTDERTFNNQLMTRHPPTPEEVQRTGHAVVLSHGDLALRNIVIDGRGRLLGLVDWEHAGWYPEYWELTAFHATIPQRRWADVCSPLFPGAWDFEDELAVERRLWEYL